MGESSPAIRQLVAQAFEVTSINYPDFSTLLMGVKLIARFNIHDLLVYFC